jgi:hypothetical protein
MRDPKVHYSSISNFWRDHSMKVSKPSVSTGSPQRHSTTAKKRPKHIDGATEIDFKNRSADVEPMALGVRQPLGEQAVKLAIAVQSAGVESCILTSQAAANDKLFYSPKLGIDSATRWDDIWQSHVIHPADLGEAIAALQDTWQRMALHKAMHIAVLSDAVTGQNLLLLRVDVDDLDSDGYALLEAASHVAHYFWSQSDGKGSFASDVRWIGSTLLIELTPMLAMRRWPNGDALVFTMQALLHHVRQLGRMHPRPVEHYWSGTNSNSSPTSMSKY